VTALYIDGKKDYEITAEDLLWLGRAAQGEGGDPRAVIWAMLQRFSLPAFRHTFPTLTSFVRAFSQPVNPRWMRGGDKCATGGSGYGTPDCAERLLDRREEMSSRDPATFSADVKAAIAALSKGSLANPVPRVVNFAVGDRAREYVAAHPGSQLVGCCYIITPESARWPNNYVALGPSTWPYVVGGFVAGLAVFGTAAWFIWRHR